MAATFVVEDGTGKSDANSNLSVAGADQYHENNSASTDWSGATQADKEKAIRLATQYLDVRYDGSLKGCRSNEDQALAMPRTGIEDSDGYYYDSDEMPQRWLDATAELALRVIEGDTLLDDITKPGTIKSQSVTVGPIKKSIKYMGGYNQFKGYPLIDGLVRPLIKNNSSLERG